MVQQTGLPGSWRKQAQTACAEQYAATLRFEENGLYVGTAEPVGAFTWWDQGTWEIRGPTTLALSTANDEVVSYRIELLGDDLSITDAAGCTVRYRRSE